MATKAIYIPQPGHFITDGTRLLEVVASCKEGFQVIDASLPLADDSVEDDPRGVEVLAFQAGVNGAWRRVVFVPEEV